MTISGGSGNGIGGTNGIQDAIAGGKIITPAKFEFTEMQFRAVLAEVKKLAAQANGALPIPDPLSVLAIGLVMDKLNEISERLAVIEKVTTTPVVYEHQQA